METKKNQKAIVYSALLQSPVTSRGGTTVFLMQLTPGNF